MITEYIVYTLDRDMKSRTYVNEKTHKGYRTKTIAEKVADKIANNDPSVIATQIAKIQTTVYKFKDRNQLKKDIESCKK